MDTQSLATFLALCQHKSFSRAANSLFITQSTVTKRIAELEREVGKALFRRDNKHVTLTEEGSIFANYAKRIVELEEAAVKDMNANVAYQNYLRLGVTNSIYECHLIELISAYLREETNAVKITIDHSSELLMMLQDGTLDVAFVFYPLHKPGFECLPFQRDELVLVTGFENRQYETGIFKSSLKEINYLMCNFALKEVGTFIRELFPKHYPFSFEIDNSTKLIPYLVKGIGYSFLPLKMVEEHIAAGALRAIPLIDFQAPVIESYCVGKSGARQVWAEFLG